MRAALALAAFAGGCGGDGAQPPAGGGTGNTPPVPTTSRLAWSQSASSLAAVQGYRFVLFVDNTRSSLESVSCVGGSSPYECSTPLPTLPSGRHMLQLAAVDPSTGAESGRSESLVVGQQTIAGVMGETNRLAADHVADVRLPSVTCATGDASLCFTATLAATGLAPVRRLLALPDARVLLLHENGQVTFLPSGMSDRPELGRREPGVSVDITDVAVDPDFKANRFLYFATVATAPTGTRRVDVFRVRELADRVGEAAMIVSLPAAPAGHPAISAGLDDRLYVAMPSAPASPLGEGPYDGRVLRFTRDGAAAGHERSGSPILAMGSARPVSLAWDAESRLLIASDDRREPRLLVVALSHYSDSTVWPVTAVPVGSADGPAFQAGLRALALGRPWATGRTQDATAAIVGTDPGSLYLATLAMGSRLELTSLHHVPLGEFAPTAVAFADMGDLFVAGRLGVEGSPVGVLRLRAR